MDDDDLINEDEIKQHIRLLKLKKINNVDSKGQ
jgi:hypothetical protein